MKFNSLIPELSVSDIKTSLDFYVKLGFRVVYERKEDKFAFLELENNQIMIEEINNNWNTGKLEYPFGRGINLSMTINDIDSFYKKVLELKLKLYLELETHSYKVEEKEFLDKEFLIQDPDGYLLRFNS